MPSFIVYSVSPTHEQSNRSYFNNFEQEPITYPLSEPFQKTQVHCSKNVITRERIVKTAQNFALQSFLSL